MFTEGACEECSCESAQEWHQSRYEAEVRLYKLMFERVCIVGSASSEFLMCNLSLFSEQLCSSVLLQWLQCLLNLTMCIIFYKQDPHSMPQTA